MANWTIGALGRADVTVRPEVTAQAVKSGLLPVFATPCLVALMEEAAVRATLEGLEEGMTSVGIRIEVQHEAATPIGGTVVAEATLTAVEGRKLTFAIVAYDEFGTVGHAAHERFLVDAERFMEKARARATGEKKS